MFGCEAWAHILDEKQKALQPKSEKCIFVGYSKDAKGYRLLQPHSHDIIIIRDVKFDENLASLTWWVCHLWPVSLIRQLCLLLLLLLLLPTSLTGFQIQFLMMRVRMKIHLRLLMFLQLHLSSTLNADKLLSTHRAYKIHCQPREVFCFKG